MAELSYTITGDVNVRVTITDLMDGTLGFRIDVLDDTGSIGDLNGFFFDLADDSLTTSLIIEGADVTGTALKVDGVTKVDNFTNVNGEVVKELGKFDGGVQFGTAGMAGDDIRSTSFTISSSLADLTLDDFAFQDIAVRLTSVGAEGGSREDSLKLGGTLPEAPPEEPNDPVYAAEDDYITVLASEGFGDVDAFILANDSKDGGVYDEGVYDLAGTEVTAPTTLTDPLTGALLTIYPDGSVDFSANGQFDSVPEGEAGPPVVFSYALVDGTTANIYVTVLGEGGGPEGPGGPGDPFDPMIPS